MGRLVLNKTNIVYSDILIFNWANYMDDNNYKFNNKHYRVYL